MLQFLTENLGTILVGLAVALLLTLVVVKLLRDRKKGKSVCSCGGACSGCPGAAMCHHGQSKT
ncbi:MULTISPECIES: FeoB-associated Cys-rich membrane protein [unclassified Clostridium]|jgi:hypothetical protein|uniref:FeoB-associated Cys-rich membrane protein n=1 Tax=Clostridia TaxID=186801 RepID=UPI001107489F|nr:MULTISPECIES: FeoB-associated Cys-rich membrane protein [unclassified Clostridium]